MPDALRLPFAGISADGIVDLGADGLAVICRASAVTFSLRTPTEQEALVAGFARLLNSLAGPSRSSCGPSRSTSPRPSTPCSTPRPACHTRPWRRGPRPRRASWPTWPPVETCCDARCWSCCANPPSQQRWRRRPGRLHRRAAEAATALAAAGVTLVVLDGPAAAACLARALDPAGALTTPRCAPPGSTAPLSTAPTSRSPSPARKEIRDDAACSLASPAQPLGPPRRSAPTPSRSGPGPCGSGTAGAPASPSPATRARSAHGWLEPLTAHPSRLDVAVHVEPVPANIAADRLRRQLARLESGRRADAAKGRLGDPEVEVAAEDARDLAAGLARGEQKLFRVGLYLTVHARTEEAARRRVRPGPRGVRLDAPRRPAGHLAHPAGLDLHPARRGRRARPATHLRHRRPGRVVPVRLGRAVRHQRRPLRHRHQRVGAGAVGPLRPGQPQLGHPRPLRGRQVLPGQARSAALAVRRDRDRGGRPRGRVPPPGRDRRRRLRPPRRPRRAGQPLRPRPRPRRPHPPGPVRPHPHRRPARRQARPGSHRGARPGDRRRLRVGRDHRPTPAATPAPHRCSATWPPRWTPTATPPPGRWPPGWPRS